MAELIYTTAGYVIAAPEKKLVTDDFGGESPRWTVNLGAEAGGKWGTLVEVADPKLAEVLAQSVGKRVTVKGLVNSLPGGKRGAWTKLTVSSVVPA